MVALVIGAPRLIWSRSDAGESACCIPLRRRPSRDPSREFDVARPEAANKRLSISFFTSADQLEDYVAFNHALINGDADVERLIDAARDFDTDVIEANTVGFVSWSEVDDLYAVCDASAAICSPATSVAVFPG